MRNDSLVITVAAIGIIWFLAGEMRSRGYFAFKSRLNSDDEFHRSRLVSVLLSLDQRSFDDLMQLYKKEFGLGPARYARRTYKKWKTGKVQPNVETYRRFLVHLPEVMSFDLKCETLRLFMEEYAAEDDFELDLYIDEWEVKLPPLIDQIVDKAFNAQLPKELERKLRWLGEGDMNIAQQMLRASQAEESRIMASMLRDEFANIEKLLAEEHLKPRVRHVIKFPYGTISLNIRRR
jgi:hypothetical protein